MSSHDDPESAPKRERLDVRLVALGHAPTRDKAKALIMTGRVQVDGRVVDKAGTQIGRDTLVSVLSPPSPWVSRGGLKLDGALTHFQLEMAGRVALDLGSSTGGFAHCLLERGVRRVYAVDVGRGLLDWTLREDPRVVVCEGVNARYLSRQEIPEAVAIVTADLAFISLRLVLPTIYPLLATSADVLLLVKPQFELGRGEVGKGIVRDPEKHRTAIRSVVAAARSTALVVRGVCASPITGAKGNREFFLWLATGGLDLDPETVEQTIARVVANANELAIPGRVAAQD